MAQDIQIMNMTIEDVPAVNFNKVGGETAKYIDETDIVTVYKGTSAPSASLGNMGDLYAQK